MRPGIDDSLYGVGCPRGWQIGRTRNRRLDGRPGSRRVWRGAETAIKQQIAAQAAAGGPDAEIIGKTVPQILLTLLNRPGCIYASYDPEAAGNADPNDPVPQLAKVCAGLRATLIVNAGSEADAIAEKLKPVVEQFPEEIRTKNLQNQTLPGLPEGVSLTLHRHENYFILGFGKDTVQAAVAGLKGEVKGLAASERFKSALRMPNSRGQPTLSFATSRNCSKL